MKEKKIWLFCSFLYCLPLFAQTSESLTWWYPDENQFAVIEGQGWPKEELETPYGRLPAHGEKMVRKPVWNLSKNATGEIIRFKTNAKKITVQYAIRGRLDLPHFAAMGFSGVDLYSVGKDGEWQWGPANYRFGDTINFRYTISADDHDYKKGREYRLYLPIYNTIKWLKIGYPPGTVFIPLPVRTEKPIVVYGTSITQGGCASRSGMTWPSIVGRRLDEPFVNLGFSGNGTLDTGMISLLTEIDAKVYILDCLANLMNRSEYSLDEVKRRIMASVNYLHHKRPSVPIILPAFAAFNEQRLDKSRGEAIAKIDQALKECYLRLKAEGIHNLFLLTRKEINLGLEATVDGTHATDLGFMEYADAIEKILRIVLNKPAGRISTAEPRIQYRNDDVYDWEAQHDRVLQENKTHPPKLIIVGAAETGVMNTKFRADLQATRICFYGDRIENILWRVEHGELDGFKAKQVVLTLGTGNLQINSDAEMTRGVEFLLGAIKRKQPSAAILLIGMPAAKGEQQRVARLNAMFKRTAAAMNIRFLLPSRLWEKDAASDVREQLKNDLYADSKDYDLLTGFLKQSLK